MHSYDAEKMKTDCLQVAFEIEKIERIADGLAADLVAVPGIFDLIESSLGIVQASEIKDDGTRILEQALFALKGQLAIKTRRLALAEMRRRLEESSVED